MKTIVALVGTFAITYTLGVVSIHHSQYSYVLGIVAGFCGAILWR